MITAAESLARTERWSEATQAVMRCRLLDGNGGEIARGEAHVAFDDGFLVAVVQRLAPVGAVTLAIFGHGQRRFVLDLADGGRQPVELISSRFQSGRHRVCFFRGLERIAPAGAQLQALQSR